MKKIKIPKRESVLFIKHIPQDLKDQFKAWCYRRGIDMSEYIRKHMKDCVKQDRDLAIQRSTK